MTEQVTKDSDPIDKARWFAGYGPVKHIVIDDDWMHDYGANLVNGDPIDIWEHLALLHYARLLEHFLDPERFKDG